jgi:Zn-dependent protease with chaperone function
LLEGKLYDGVTGLPHDVRVAFRDGRLDLSRDSGWSDSIPADRLKRVDADSSTLRLGHRDAPGWRLSLPAAAEEQVSALIGRRERYGGWIDRIGLVPALAAFGAVTAAILAIGYLSPQWLAPHVPPSWERNVGDAIVGDFGDNRCRGAEGQRVLNTLAERLDPGATRGGHAVRLATLDFPIFNAAALPGGHIVVFQGALDEVDDPDALAGIVAHEIAHVRRRHVTQALIRELGIGALIRLFAGDIGVNAEQLVALSYTRQNEAEADEDAIAMLRRASISPKATADLFARLGDADGEEPGFTGEFLQSHPLTGKRAERFAAAEEKGATYVRALSDKDFHALKMMCRADEQS